MKMGEETDIAEPMPSEDVVAAENVTANEPSKLGNSKRKRKRSLYQSLLNLMEFYLGDANLSKDRFMLKQIEGQPFVYVDLAVFLTFNKVRALTQSIEDLARALDDSEILQISEDRTQVCRKTPIKKKENEDECTIYVEQIGPQMDHEYLVKLFSQFGPVDYVSIPRYSASGKIKGFAFVEFRDPQTAKEALEALNAKGCCLSPDMAPQELLSIRNFDTNKENKGESDVKSKTRDTSHDQVPSKSEENNLDDKLNDKSKDTTEIAVEDKSLKKDRKKRKNNEQNDNLKYKSKEFDQVECSKQRGKDENIPKKEKENVDILKLPHQDNSEESESVSDDKVSRKKIKKRTKSISHEKSSNQSMAGLKVENEVIVSDAEKLQGKKKKRKHEDEIKCEESLEPVKKKPKSDVEDAENSEECGEEIAEDKKNRKRKRTKKVQKPSAFSLGLKVLPKKEWKRLRNKYLNMQRDMMRTLKQHLSNAHKSSASQGSEEAVAKLEDTCKSGTVLKVILEEPITNVKAAKGDMRVHPEIRYVDVTEGSPVVYLRTSTPEVAASVLSAQHWPNIQLVQGEEESQYWNKIKMDREEHLKKSKPNVRGRTKLLKRAERFNGKHTRHFETL